MTSGIISGCSAMYGGGISASGCTVRISRRTASKTARTSEHSGGLYIGGHADQISVLDAAISGCEAKRGGGVALIAFAELELGRMPASRAARPPKGRYRGRRHRIRRRDLYGS